MGRWRNGVPRTHWLANLVVSRPRSDPVSKKNCVDGSPVTVPRLILQGLSISQAYHMCSHPHQGNSHKHPHVRKHAKKEKTECSHRGSGRYEHFKLGDMGSYTFAYKLMTYLIYPMWIRAYSFCKMKQGCWYEGKQTRIQDLILH